MIIKLNSKKQLFRPRKDMPIKKQKQENINN